MLLTQLEYFVAVAREQHFGRAAAACFVSPSALSEAIRKLEIELGVPLVRRGRAFEGITPEGELALVWARRVLADDRSLRDALGTARGRLAAEVRLGVIPAGVTRAAALVAALARRHPLVRVRMSTGLTSEEIIGRVRRYELDAGLIHPSLDDVDDLVLTPLYEDPLVVVGAATLLAATGGAVSGAALAGLPVCLLEPHMRARQLLDAALERNGIVLTPHIETDSVEGLLALARTGDWVAVVPHSATERAVLWEGLRAVPLAEPDVRIPIVLAHLAEEPRSPIAAAFDEAVPDTRAR